MSNEASKSGSRDAEKQENIFNPALVFMDDSTWVWEFVQKAIQPLGQPFTKVASDMPIRASWNRFHKAPFIITHWENRHRQGGAIIEEIMSIDKDFDIANRLVVITTNPVHEDVVFFSELGITRVIRPRQRDRELLLAIDELRQHIREIVTPTGKATIDDLWQTVFAAIQKIPLNPPETVIGKIEERITKLSAPNSSVTPRELEALSCLRMKCQQFTDAEKLLNDAIAINPNYFRAWNRLIDLKRERGLHQEAYALLQKMQLHNRSSIRRLVAMGEELLALNDNQKAEYYFKSALDKDGRCAGALNGLAEVRFMDGELEEARSLLAKSDVAYKFAVKLNHQGIVMVREGAYEKALEHYSKAQYVLPLQEKGPQLLYNIALCYAKWGRLPMAEEFLKLALIKEPNYKKALKTLDQIRLKPETVIGSDLDAA